MQITQKIYNIVNNMTIVLDYYWWYGTLQIEGLA